MIETIIALLGTSSIGSIIGGVLGLMNKRVDVGFEVKKLNHQLEMRDRDITLARIEGENALAVQVEVTEGDRMEAIGSIQSNENLSAEILKASGSGRGWYIAVDVLRRAIRPVATIALVAAAFFAVGTVLTVNELGLTREAFLWITGQASACLSFWFLSRTK